MSVLVQHGQVGLCFYDSKDSSLHYMTDTSDDHKLHLLARGKHNVLHNLILSTVEMTVMCIPVNRSNCTTLRLVLQEVKPHVLITSAKQELCMTRFLQQLGEFWEIHNVANIFEIRHIKISCTVFFQILGQGN